MSKIFEEYFRIAEEQGLITKEAYPMEKRLDRDPTDVELLYGIKPNGKDDDKNMVDQAHPGVAVVSPAYDRFDGVVENQNQQSNISNYIALRPPNGLYQQKRFVTAHKDLVNSLVRVGFILDNKDENDLMKLADSCNERLTKEALGPALVIGLIAGGVALTLGALGIINRTSNSRQNVINNSEAVLRELEDLQGKMNVSAVMNDVRFLQNSAKDFASKATPVPLKDVKDVLNASETNSTAISAARYYKAVLDIMSRRLPEYISELRTVEAQEDYKPDWWQKIEDVGRQILSVTTDKEDSILALEGLQKAVEAAKTETDHIMKKARDAKPTLEAELVAYQKSQEGSPSVEAPSPEKPPSNPKEEAAGALTDLVNKTMGA